MIILGMGPDGHTTSLFPGDRALEETTRLAAGVPEPGRPPCHSRITLTLPLLNQARQILFLIRGRKKESCWLKSWPIDVMPPVDIPQP